MFSPYCLRMMRGDASPATKTNSKIIDFAAYEHHNNKTASPVLKNKKETAHNTHKE